MTKRSLPFLLNKILNSIIVAAILCSISVVSANASVAETRKSLDTIISETTEYYSDGSSITIIVAELQQPQSRASAYTKKGYKAYVARDKKGNELWRFTVNGTFSINSGVSASCTAASYNVKITEDSWQKESASVKRSENQAIGEATFIKKILLITTDRKSCRAVLSCDKNGKLS